ncbi:MAG: DNA translocase FtsK [Candidatus Omnitrophota bacterium]|nr:DNA translocase FtsK [Candidatus Omnitrophota bacterium]
MKERRLNEVKGVILFAIGLMVLLSLLRFNCFDLSFYTSHPNYPPKNLLGIFGAYLAGIIIFLLGRGASFVIPLVILSLGIKFFRQEKPYLSVLRLVWIFILLLSLSSFIGMFNLKNENSAFFYAGFLGANISNFVTACISRIGGFVLFTTCIILSFVFVTEILISSLFISIIDKIKLVLKLLFKFFKIGKKSVALDSRGLKAQSPALKAKPAASLTKSLKPPVAEIPVVALQNKPNIQIKVKSSPELNFKPQGNGLASFSQSHKPQGNGLASFSQSHKPQETKIGDYQLPSLDLLDSPPPIEARQIKEDLTSSARILEETLEDFGISVKVTDIERGPVITRYELEPAPGVKLNRIVALNDDIALTMKAQSVRILAPIPGKGRVGIEVPNTVSSFVYLKEVIASAEFQKAKFSLALSLGKDITGGPIIADLDDMPHLLIAGTTGSGKTVCVNSFILSLLFKNTPNDLKFLMIDPKMVELMPFNGLPHLICPVVTDAKKASQALNWVVAEMEERYQLLAKVSARNIESYNEKQEKLPYIIVIIDEFADLMNVAADTIENAIQRLAQLSRAVGIHLILATQRPSVNVITGVIKANLPARVSFKVASKVDSRTVLDMNGADKLLGKGDMLFLRPGESKLIRIQGAFIKDKEIENVVNFIKSQGAPVYDEDILKEQSRSSIGNMEKDDLYDEAVRIIMEMNQASVSVLQRKLRLGYTRAARIVDTMEQEGLLGPFEGSKPRTILVDREPWLAKK